MPIARPGKLCSRFSPAGRRAAPTTGVAVVGVAAGLAAVWLGACGENAPQAAAAEPTWRFPLKVAANQRHLVDQEGRPFLIHGDTAWSLVAQLDEAETRRYLDDRQRRGFNAILVNLLEHKFADKPPRNKAGESPFRVEGDLTTPNEAYFAHVDAMLRQAGERGIVVLLTPAYLVWDGNDEGWFQTLKKNGPEKLRAYGKFVGARYRDFPNLVWVVGGDFTPPPRDRWTVEELALGLREADPNHLVTGHGSQQSPAEVFGDAKWLDVANVYSYDTALHKHVADEYRRQPTRPFFMMESAYENEHGARGERIRRQAHAALLCGAAGHLYGNNPMWNFNSPAKVFATDKRWQDELNSQGAQDMARLMALWGPRPWHTLVPDFEHAFLVKGHGDWNSAGYASAALAADGAWGVVYSPSDGARELEVDLSKLRGKTQARWFDPTSGEFRPAAAERLANKGRQLFAKPGRNHAGDRDWLLVLEAE